MNKRLQDVMSMVKRELSSQGVSVPTEALQALADRLSDMAYYNVEVIRKPKKATERLNLTDHRVEESFLLDKGKKETGQVVFGSAQFGLIYHHEVDGKTEEHGYDPSFKKGQPFIAIIDSKEWNEDENGPSYGGRDSTIIFYIPTTRKARKVYEKAVV